MFPLRVLALLCIYALGACDMAVRTGDPSDGRIRAVATTSMVADLVERVGGDRVAVEGLMGPGIDPHLYRASEGDVRRIVQADVIFYNGLHLESKLGEIFEHMGDRIPTVPVAEAVDPSRLLASPDYPGTYDPHVWLDVGLWMRAVERTAEALSELDPAHEAVYRSNAREYLRELEALDAYVQAQAARIPREGRVLITAHDAFSYFGRAYGFEVRGLQGISTVSEAGTADIQRLADFIAGRGIPAVFVESSVSPRAIEAVQAAVRARGSELAIGGHLYSDALGDEGTPEGTYIGMVRHNIDTLVRGLLQRS